MADDQSFPIRSYRVCFELERRIHKIDRWRLPTPYGVPLRGIAYAAAALLAVVLIGRLPVVGDVLGVLHPALRLVIVPVAVAYLLTQLRVDGRPAHDAAFALVRLKLSPQRVAGFRAAPLGATALGDLTFAPDEGSARYRPALVRGPASVLLRYPARATRRRGTLRIEQTSERPMWRGKRVTVRDGQRLVVR